MTKIRRFWLPHGTTLLEEAESPTQGDDLRELQEMIQDATLGYFRALGVKAPDTVRLHFATDPQLALA